MGREGERLLLLCFCLRVGWPSISYIFTWKINEKSIWCLQTVHLTLCVFQSQGMKSAQNKTPSLKSSKVGIYVMIPISRRISEQIEKLTLIIIWSYCLKHNKTKFPGLFGQAWLGFSIKLWKPKLESEGHHIDPLINFLSFIFCSYVFCSIANGYNAYTHGELKLAGLGLGIAH